MDITFDGYTFSFSLLTSRNRYEPAQYVTFEAAGGLVARAHSFSYGEGSGATSGLLDVTFARYDGGLSWQARAGHAESIKGIKVAISPLPLGTVMVPNGVELNLSEGDSGRCFVYPGGYYPLRHLSSTHVEPRSGPLPIWSAQLALLRQPEHTLYLHAREYPPRVKKLWVYHRGEHQEIRVYSEADAHRRSREYTAPVWYLDEVAEWTDAVEDHARWMAYAYGLRSPVVRPDIQPWLTDIALVVILHGHSQAGKVCHDFDAMGKRLEELAALFPPERTLVKLVGFEGRAEHNLPSGAPDRALGSVAGFDRLMKTAREHGFRIMAFLNVWGASLDNPATQGLLIHQVHDPEGRPLGWSWDYDEDEIPEDVFAYISPDVPEWRDLLRRTARDLVGRYGVDAIYLDQMGTYVNDLHHDHFRGLEALLEELRTDLPDTLIVGEGPTTEVSAMLSPLLGGVSRCDGEASAELHRRLFGSFVREHGHSARGLLGPNPGVWDNYHGDEWSEEQFDSEDEQAAQVNGIPTLNLTDSRIEISGKLVERVLDRARKYAPTN